MFKAPKLNRRSILSMGGSALVTTPAASLTSGCEALFVTKDRGAHPSAPKAGDMVVAKPLNSPWGEFEIGEQYYTCAVTGQKKHCREHPNGNHPFFRVVRFALISESQISVLAQAGFYQEVPPLADPQYPSYRSFYVDFLAVPDEYASLKTFISDDSRKIKMHTSHISYSELKKAIRSRQEVFV